MNDGVFPMRLVFGLCLIGLCGCASFPVLDDRLDAAARDAPYPTLLPLDPLIAQANAAPAGASPGNASMNDRIANLSRRAESLRGAIIETGTRARMQRGVDRSALL